MIDARNHSAFGQIFRICLFASLAEKLAPKAFTQPLASNTCAVNLEHRHLRRELVWRTCSEKLETYSEQINLQRGCQVQFAQIILRELVQSVQRNVRREAGADCDAASCFCSRLAFVLGLMLRTKTIQRVAGKQTLTKSNIRKWSLRRFVRASFLLQVCLCISLRKLSVFFSLCHSPCASSVCEILRASCSTQVASSAPVSCCKLLCCGLVCVE